LPGWRVEERDAADVASTLAEATRAGVSVTHMGRDAAADALFFASTIVAGSYAAEL